MSCFGRRGEFCKQFLWSSQYRELRVGWFCTVSRAHRKTNRVRLEQLAEAVSNLRLTMQEMSVTNQPILWELNKSNTHSLSRNDRCRKGLHRKSSKRSRSSSSNSKDFEQDDSVGGSLGNRTMRVRAVIHHQELNALIDSGSSHNFINQLVVSQLNLVVTLVTPFCVRIANGDKLECHARYDKVPISIQGFDFETTSFGLPIWGLDLVLGYQWLEGLGYVGHNYAQRNGNRVPRCSV
ncbi:hypothetical protein Patl1_25651 [Pistacia atlantica]|uniref:Uncharacterized protein n=1 Tax=Pistacia atlantica TaxID=434234 RepID=A0ACC1B082_9ROSI|nr:hypothetical protein Patl1_25651 [Pistacia atlantica]